MVNVSACVQGGAGRQADGTDRETGGHDEGTHQATDPSTHTHTHTHTHANTFKHILTCVADPTAMPMASSMRFLAATVTVVY